MIKTAGPESLRKGMLDGLPIALGYLSVSFTFGMMATSNGLPVWIAVLVSATNLTSAGQFAGTALIISGGMLVEIAVATLVINLRYMLMSLSLSQKLDPAMTLPERCLLAFGNTDEIFAVAMRHEGFVGARYLAGLIITPYLGWFSGTLLGATATGLLPASLRGALGIAIYGMFIAILVPHARKMRPVAFAILVAALSSCLFRWLPVLKGLSSGWAIILCTLLAAALTALRYPVGGGDGEGEAS